MESEDIFARVRIRFRIRFGYTHTHMYRGTNVCLCVTSNDLTVKGQLTQITIRKHIVFPCIPHFSYKASGCADSSFDLICPGLEL